MKAVLTGKDVANKNALANPQVLDEIRDIRKKLLDACLSKI